PLQSEVFERSYTDSFKLSPEKMADSGQEPTIKDVMNCMKTIDTRLVAIELKLHAIDSLEKKVCDFDKELKKIWVALEDRVKRTDARVCPLEEKVELVDVGATKVADRLTQSEKERNELRDDVAYLKSQSMRNNLVFTNIPEDNSTGSEPPEVTERKLRNQLEEKLKIANETADAMRFERTNYQMHEQFPPEVLEKRRKLVPHMKDARKEGKRAWIAYDTLYVDGKPDIILKSGPRELLSLYTRKVQKKIFDFEDKEINFILKAYDELLEKISNFREDIFPPLQYLFKSKAFKRVEDASETVLAYIKKRYSAELATYTPGVQRHLADHLILARQEAEKEEDPEVLASLTETHIRQTLADIFFAGINTSRSTLRFAVLHMIANPKIQQKVQQEIDRVVGQDRLPCLSDRPDLAYT
ncbi:hypothetical protein DPMN_092898, partial [Dreissena polymorpha]